MLIGYDLTALNSENLEIAKAVLDKREKNTNIDKLIELAQGGDESAFLQVYEYYKPYAEYLFFKHEGALVDGVDKEELSTLYKTALVKSIQLYDKSIYGAMTTCIAEYTLKNLNVLVGTLKSKGKCEVSEICSLDAKLSFGDDYNSAEMIASESVYNEQMFFGDDEDCMKRMLSLLSTREREFLLGYFKKQTLSGYSKEVGLTRQRCSQILQSIQKKIYKLKHKADMVSKEFYEKHKSISQIARDRKMKKANVGYYIRLQNYIYNGGELPKLKDLEYAIASCVLDEEELQIFAKFTRQSTESLISEYGEDGYKNLVLPVMRKVRLLEVKMEAVADCFEDGDCSDQFGIRRVCAMGENEKYFYVSLYRYAYLGGEKPLIPKSAKEKLAKSLDSYVSNDSFCGY